MQRVTETFLEQHPFLKKIHEGKYKIYLNHIADFSDHVGIVYFTDIDMSSNPSHPCKQSQSTIILVTEDINATVHLNNMTEEELNNVLKLVEIDYR